jgi:hypothetical protein
MKFWKKVFKKFKKQKDKNLKKLKEDKYFQKLHNKLKNIDKNNHKKKK